MAERMKTKLIRIRGARTHNLKNIDLDIPRGKLVVFTGVSGSGKSSLAFDTLFAEGQRRYVESLSTYARQFIGLMDRADVDLIEGLSPSIAIEQKTANRNPRSTVGTSSEINDYLRLLFARAGTPWCPTHNIPLNAMSVSKMVDEILRLPESSRIVVMSPIVREGGKIPFGLSDDLQAQGYTRVRVNGEYFQLPDWPELKEGPKNSVDVVIDRLKVRTDVRQRLAEDLETALRLSDGLALVLSMDTDEEQLFSDKFACPYCGYEVPELEPNLFSFNSPRGACATCNGLGQVKSFDPRKVVVFPELSLETGAVENWGKKNLHHWKVLEKVASEMSIDLSKPWEQLDPKEQNFLLYGNKENQKGSLSFEGIIGNAMRLEKESKSEAVQAQLQTWKSFCDCPSCQGDRLCEAARFTFIGEGDHRQSIAGLSKMTLTECQQYFRTLKLEGSKKDIGKTLTEEILHRLKFLIQVGLHYLTLDRRADTLSGGEAQRIRLAGQIGSRLSGVMYILDEPSIGLHQVDNERLIGTLKALRDNGNTVIVVEHDEDTIREADFVVDIGPGAGEHGGNILAVGSPKEIEENPASITGQYLSGKQHVLINKKRLSPGEDWLEIKGASGHNLKNVNLRIPVGLITVVCGVSGSGKSSLINGTLYPLAAHDLNRATTLVPLPYESVNGLQHFDKVIVVDQSPIGKTPRSNPATYTGVFNVIREIFSQIPLSRERGYGADRFSFNLKGGRCEACQGEGLIKVEMNMLPDMYVSCDVCHGSRYNRETLDVLYKGLSIAQVLDLTITQAAKLFENIPALKRKLDTLIEVGLGYIKLGQSSTTLSGGEAQRVKLALELSKKSTGKTLFILDEPTTGLHFHDVTMLLKVLNRLKAAGNTIVIIEHNLDVIKSADWLVEMGPDGGTEGGLIVAEGTPEEIGEIPSSKTGQYLGNL